MNSDKAEKEPDYGSTDAARISASGRRPATRAALEHGLSLLRCLEVANRLSPNLHGEALARIHEETCPAAEWPWPGLMGPEVLRLLWSRLALKNEQQTLTQALANR